MNGILEFENFPEENAGKNLDSARDYGFGLSMVVNDLSSKEFLYRKNNEGMILSKILCQLTS